MSERTGNDVSPGRFPCPCCNGRGYHDYEPFTPNYAIHPGETVKEVFEENRLSNRVAATALGLSEQYVGEVVNGKKAISAKMAHRLARVFGPGERFWISLQANYEADCKRIGRKP